MDPLQEQAASELFQAQSHVYKHIFNFANSMSLACALELGIPDVIHNHHPITPQQLLSLLKLPTNKTEHLCRLMRLLVHNKFFLKTKFNDDGEEKEGYIPTPQQLLSLLKLPTNKTEHLCRLMRLLVHNKFFLKTKFNDDGEEKEGYIPTPSSRLLLKNEVTSLHPFVQAMSHSVLLTPWQFLGKWFRGNEPTPFQVAHGIPLWELMDKNSDFGKLFDKAMASDSQMLTASVNGSREIFEGVESLVDVGGGTGDFVKVMLEAFPHIMCTVFDLPRAVADLPESRNLKFVRGDMFQSIPPADAILFKWVLHDWCDEDCVKILKKCRESIIPIKDGKGGKVIIIDMVIDGEKDVDDITETKLIFDILMMVDVGGKERNEKESEKLFLEAGFSHYKITPVFGFKSFIEVFP